MDYAQLEYYISPPRINRYLRACGNSKAKTQKLYKINLRVSQAFYPLMNLFETFIRNAIYNKIEQHFHDQDWIINEKIGLMSDPSLANSNYFLRKNVENAEANIRRSRCAITSSKIIAEQTLGFWTAFFDTHHFILIQGASLTAFPNKPHFINRSLMAAKLKRIRDFRNRIYHNEPICFKGAAIDFSVAQDVMCDIHEIMEWISPHLKLYTDYFNNINSKIAQVHSL